MPPYLSMGTDDGTVIKATAVSFATTTATGQIASVTGSYIRVYKLFLTVATTMTLTFEDGTTALSGAIDVTAGTPFVLPMDGNPWFTTSAGNPFTIVSGTSGQVSGVLYYTASPWAG